MEESIALELVSSKAGSGGDCRRVGFERMARRVYLVFIREVVGPGLEID